MKHLDKALDNEVEKEFRLEDVEITDEEDEDEDSTSMDSKELARKREIEEGIRRKEKAR